MKMKVIKEIKVKSKESLLVKVKETQTMPFFKSYQKMIQYNIIHPIIYSILLLMECIQLFYQITIHYDDDLIKQSTITNEPYSASYHFLRILQYIDCSHFVQPFYLSFNSYVILYSITVSLISLNLIALLLIEYLENHWTIKTHQLKNVHIVYGLFNYINSKIFVIPTYIILFRSFTINSFISIDDTDNMNLFNKLTNSRFESVPLYSYIIICIVSVISVGINAYMLINTGLFFNDIDIIQPKLCGGQSSAQLEMIRLIQKIVLVSFNTMAKELIFPKGISIVLINGFYCIYRYLEWYYTTRIYKTILISIDYSFFFYSIVILVYKDIQLYIDQIIFLIIVSGVIGFLSSCIINYSHRYTLGIKPKLSIREYDVARIVIQLIHLIQNLSNDNKSINDPILFGFYKEHNKHCKNNHCISHLFSELVYKSKGKFMNQIESFELKKSDFNLYCKANSNDAFEILPDNSKVQCEKALYSLISCIISSSLPKLQQASIVFLPIIEVYLYIHIFNNPLYGLFQVMKYYRHNLSYRKKFLYYQVLNKVLRKIKKNNANKNSIQADLVTVTNYYYYSEQFVNTTFEMITTSKVLFYKLIKMKPTPQEVLNLSYSLGKQIKKMHHSFTHINKINPSDITIVRLYSFIIGKIFLMKKTAQQNHFRLLQNIKLFIMNDKFKNSSGISQNNSSQYKISLKTFQENSESALMIISGILENLGDILYCNHLITSIAGYEKKELIGVSMNKLLPHPLSEWHNDFILSLYKTGNMSGVNHSISRLLVHKNRILVNVDVFIANMPNIKYGLLYISMLKNSKILKLEAQRQLLNKATHVNVQEDDLQKKDSNQDDHPETKSTAKSDNNLIELKNVFRKHSIRTMYYQVDDTGILFLSDKLDILYMNFYAMCNLFNLNKPFNQGKINITKICKDFNKKRAELDNGEVVNLLFDLTLVINQINQGKSLDELIMTTTSLQNKRLKATRMNSIQPKMIRSSLTKKESLNCSYYIIILQKGPENMDSSSSANFNSSSDSDDKSMNEESDDDMMNNSHKSYSRLGSIYHVMLDIEKTKEYKIEKEKNSFLSSTNIPPFTIVSNIIIYFLFVLITIWVIISYVFEFNMITKIQNDMFVLNKNQQLITTISHYIIDSLLIIRGNFFPLTNIAYLNPLLKETMHDEKINIYSIMSTVSNYFSSNKSLGFTQVVFSTSLSFKTITENNTQEILDINLDSALKKLIFSMDYLLSKDNYKNMTLEQYFNPTYHNSIKCKLYYLYYNFFEGFQSHLITFSESVQKSLNDDLRSEENSLLIIFSFSILFALFISLMLAFIFINKEKTKSKFLVSLGNVYDLFYENKIELLEKFENNLHLIIQEDQNIQHIKSLLEKDYKFRAEFIEGEDYLSNKREDEPGAEMTARSMRKSQSKTQLRHKFLELLFKRQSNSQNLNRKLLNGSETGLINFGIKMIQSAKYAPNVKKKSNQNTNENNNGYLAKKSQTQKNKKKSSASLGKKYQRTDDHNAISNTIQINSQNFLLKSLDPIENPNLNKRTTALSYKVIKNVIEDTKEQPEEEKDEEEDKALKAKEDEEDFIDEKKKPYTNFKLSWYSNCFEIILSIILINSFFVISIIYLLSYIQNIFQIISISGIIYSRIINLNNFIIAINFAFLYFNENALGNGFSFSSIELKGNQIEELYRTILDNIDKDSSFYLTINAYERKKPCLTFKGFHVEYSLITCEEFAKENGLTFEISSIYLTLHQLCTAYYNKKDMNLSPEDKALMFNNPELINILIQKNFFLRLFETDISLTHVKMYQDVLKNIKLISDIKFGFYLVLLLILVAVYKFYLLTRLIENINNLNRVMLFFDEENFKK